MNGEFLGCGLLMKSTLRNIRTLPRYLRFSNRTSSDKKSAPFTIDQHLKRQKMVLHGFEARALKHIPKIVYRCARDVDVGYICYVCVLS